MKLTIKEWNVVIKCLEQRHQELDKQLEGAKVMREMVLDKLFTENPTASERDVYQSAEYRKADKQVQNLLAEWHNVDNVLGRLKEQEI